MGSGAGDLAVVIPSYRGANRIGSTLRSLAAQAPGLRVVVVDDGSDDGTDAAARRAGAGLDLEVLRHASNRGRAAARNTGVEALPGTEWVLVLDDDMDALPGLVAAHRAAQASRDGARRAFLGRLQLPRDLPPGPFAAFLRREEEDRHRKLLAAARRVDWRYCFTGQFSVRRQALVSVGGFDEAFTLYGFEDIDLGVRLEEAGILLTYLPEAVSVHEAYAVDLARLRQRTYLTGRMAIHLARAHRDRPAVREYLRLDGMAPWDPRRDSSFTFAMKILTGLLRRRRVLAGLGSPLGERLLMGCVRALERLPLRRLRHLAYHFARDVAYFRGVADASREAGGGDPRPGRR